VVSSASRAGEPELPAGDATVGVGLVIAAPCVVCVGDVPCL
jgi:hypothetical protein